MPSGPGDLKWLKDFKAHLTLAGEAISRASCLRKPNWFAGSGRPFWEFHPTSVGPFKPGSAPLSEGSGSHCPTLSTSRLVVLGCSI